MLDLYYHLHNDDSQKATAELANSRVTQGQFGAVDLLLRANGQYKIEKTLASS